MSTAQSQRSSRIAAQESGVSANTWLLQQITRSADPKRRTHQGGRRMTGYGQS